MAMILNWLEGAGGKGRNPYLANPLNGNTSLPCHPILPCRCGGNRSPGLGGDASSDVPTLGREEGLQCKNLGLTSRDEVG